MLLKNPADIREQTIRRVTRLLTTDLKWGGVKQRRSKLGQEQKGNIVNNIIQVIRLLGI